jgi:hypothetical protein
MAEWTALICLILNIGLTVYLVALQPRFQWIKAFGRWPEIAQVVQKHVENVQRQTGAKPIVCAGDPYRLASAVAFYRELGGTGSRETTNQWLIGGKGLAYPYWMSEQEWSGRDVVYVFFGKDENDPRTNGMQDLFESVELAEDYRPPGSRVTYRIAICRRMNVPQMRAVHERAAGRGSAPSDTTITSSASAG